MLATERKTKREYLTHNNGGVLSRKWWVPPAKERETGDKVPVTGTACMVLQDSSGAFFHDLVSTPLTETHCN